MPPRRKSVQSGQHSAEASQASAPSAPPPPPQCLRGVVTMRVLEAEGLAAERGGVRLKAPHVRVTVGDDVRETNAGVGATLHMWKGQDFSYADVVLPARVLLEVMRQPAGGDAGSVSVGCTAVDVVKKGDCGAGWHELDGDGGRVKLSWDFDLRDTMTSTPAAAAAAAAPASFAARCEIVRLVNVRPLCAPQVEAWCGGGCVAELPALSAAAGSATHDGDGEASKGGGEHAPPDSGKLTGTDVHHTFEVEGEGEGEAPSVVVRLYDTACEPRRLLATAAFDPTSSTSSSPGDGTTAADADAADADADAGILVLPLLPEDDVSDDGAEPMAVVVRVRCLRSAPVAPGGVGSGSAVGLPAGPGSGGSGGGGKQGWKRGVFSNTDNADKELEFAGSAAGGQRRRSTLTRDGEIKLGYEVERNGSVDLVPGEAVYAWSALVGEQGKRFAGRLEKLLLEGYLTGETTEPARRVSAPAHKLRGMAASEKTKTRDAQQAQAGEAKEAKNAQSDLPQCSIDALLTQAWGLSRVHPVIELYRLHAEAYLKRDEGAPHHHRRASNKEGEDGAHPHPHPHQQHQHQHRHASVDAGHARRKSVSSTGSGGGGVQRRRQSSTSGAGGADAGGGGGGGVRNKLFPLNADAVLEKRVVLVEHRAMRMRTAKQSLEIQELLQELWRGFTEHNRAEESDTDNAMYAEVRYKGIIQAMLVHFIPGISTDLAKTLAEAEWVHSGKEGRDDAGNVLLYHERFEQLVLSLCSAWSETQTEFELVRLLNTMKAPVIDTVKHRVSKQQANFLRSVNAEAGGGGSAPHEAPHQPTPPVARKDSMTSTRDDATPATHDAGESSLLYKSSESEGPTPGSLRSKVKRTSLAGSIRRRSSMPSLNSSMKRVASHGSLDGSRRGSHGRLKKTPFELAEDKVRLAFEMEDMEWKVLAAWATDVFGGFGPKALDLLNMSAKEVSNLMTRLYKTGFSDKHPKLRTDLVNAVADFFQEVKVHLPTEPPDKAEVDARLAQQRFGTVLGEVDLGNVFAFADMATVRKCAVLNKHCAEWVGGMVSARIARQYLLPEMLTPAAFEDAFPAVDCGRLSQQVSAGKLKAPSKLAQLVVELACVVLGFDTGGYWAKARDFMSKPNVHSTFTAFDPAQFTAARFASCCTLKQDSDGGLDKQGRQLPTEMRGVSWLTLSESAVLQAATPEMVAMYRWIKLVVIFFARHSGRTPAVVEAYGWEDKVGMVYWD